MLKADVNLRNGIQQRQGSKLVPVTLACDSFP